MVWVGGVGFTRAVMSYKWIRLMNLNSTDGICTDLPGITSTSHYFLISGSSEL